MFAASRSKESSVRIVSTSCVIVLPETTKLPVIAKSPEIVPPVVRTTVLSTSNLTLLFAE